MELKQKMKNITLSGLAAGVFGLYLLNFGVNTYLNIKTFQEQMKHPAYVEMNAEFENEVRPKIGYCMKSYDLKNIIDVKKSGEVLEVRLSSKSLSGSRYFTINRIDSISEKALLGEKEIADKGCMEFDKGRAEFKEKVSKHPELSKLEEKMKIYEMKALNPFYKVF
jgi:hypothetical protein